MELNYLKLYELFERTKNALEQLTDLMLAELLNYDAATANAGQQATASALIEEIMDNAVLLCETPLPQRESSKKPEKPSPAATLSEYMGKWLEMVKKPVVKENTYKLYRVYYKTNIIPVLGERPVADIKPFELQEFINDLVAKGKCATAVHCRILLNALFEYAVADDIIAKSPMLKVTVPHSEPKEGVPLTREEEKKLVTLMLKKGNINVQAYVFMLYTGLRRSELASVSVRDGWVYAVSAKSRKGYKLKTRSIPVSPMLSRVLPHIDVDGIKKVNINTVSVMAKDIIPGHHAHELRHTFITRCQECGINREIVSLWAGHAADSSVTSSVYTHLQANKQLQLDQMKKFKYKL